MNVYMYGPGQINRFSELDNHKCPGDFGKVDAPLVLFCAEWKTRPFWESVGTSYGANVARFRAGDVAYSYSPYMRPLTRIEAPGDTMLYMEAIATQAVWSSIVFHYYGEAFAATLPGWHRKLATYNVVFCDGHAATVKIDRNGVLPPPPTSFDPGYTQFWIRGDGPEKWRLDTRREPLIRIGVYAD